VGDSAVGGKGGSGGGGRDASGDGSGSRAGSAAVGGGKHPPPQAWGGRGDVGGKTGAGEIDG
jgi:hypothetical protein